MYAITGITGKVGGVVARSLLQAGLPVRAVVRDAAKGAAWAARGRPVRMEPVPRDTREALFRSQGMRHPLPQIRMIDGFNEGWIDFEGGAGIEHRAGATTLEAVLGELVAA